MSNIKLNGLDSSIIFSEFKLYDRNIECVWQIENSQFSGKSNFNFYKDELSSKLNLKIFEFNDYDSDQYFNLIKLDNLGHYKVVLRIGAGYTGKSLLTYFMTDLVSIENFIKSLEAEFNL